MLVRVFQHLTKIFLNRLPATAYLGPLAITPNSSAGFSLKEVLDGLVWATPKHRTPKFKIYSRRYGNDNWKYGQKLWKPKTNLVNCMECGSFHEIHAICRNCYYKVEEESKKIIEKIRSTWGQGVVDKEVQFLYQGETNDLQERRIVELERPRPMWFAQNLRQKAANPARQVTGPAVEAVDTTIRVKNTVKNNNNTA